MPQSWYDPGMLGLSVLFCASLLGQDNLAGQLIRYRDSNQLDQMVALAKRAVDAGNRDEFVVRTLSWGLRRLSRPDEALPYAELNWKSNRVPWALSELIDAHTDTGDLDMAKTHMRFALQHRKAWGDAASPLTASLNRLSSVVWIATWEIDATKIAFKKGASEVLIPLPFDQRDYQSSVSTLSGASSYERMALGSDTVLRATLVPGQPMLLESEITLIPTSYRKRAKEIADGTFPSSTRPFLGETSDLDLSHPAVKSLAGTLKGRTLFETVDRTLTWVDRHMVYRGEDAMECGGKLSEVVTRKNGHCEAITTAAVGLLRANGIPARYIRGHGAWVPESAHPSWHTITEFYFPGIGWIPWDDGYSPFVVRNTYLATFNYGSPYAAPGGGDPEKRDLWNFQVLDFACKNVAKRVIRREFDGQVVR